jgi:hypothetical protein
LRFWGLITFVIFFRCITSPSSLLVLILYSPFNSFVGPKIFLNIFLSNIFLKNPCFTSAGYSKGKGHPITGHQWPRGGVEI